MVVVLGPFAERRGIAVAWLLVSLGLAAGCALISIAAGPLLALVALGFLRAFGQGSLPLLGTLLVTRRFDRWRGRALAAANLGTTAAAAILPAVAVGLIAAFGWRAALQVTGLVVVLAVAPLAWLTRRHGGPIATEKIERPRRRGPFAGLVHGFPWTTGGTTPLLVLATPPLVVTAVVFHAVALLQPRGFDLGAVAAALAVLSVAGAAGAMAAGFTIDRWGVRVTLAAMSAMLAVGTALLAVDEAALAILAFALVGLANGFNLIAAGAVWAKTYGVEQLGLLQGAGDGARIAGAAIGPLPLAVALGLTGGFAAGLLALATLSAAGAIASLR
jgi:MFS family permease